MTIGIDLDFMSKKTGSAAGSDSQLSMYNIKSDENFHLNSTMNQLSQTGSYGGSHAYDGNPYEYGNTTVNNFAGVAGLNLSCLAAITTDSLAGSM
jgi:hypothetical protein